MTKWLAFLSFIALTIILFLGDPPVLLRIFGDTDALVTLLSAILGFGGVIVALIYNATAERNRDKALRKQQKQALAAALAGEIDATRQKLQLQEWSIGVPLAFGGRKPPTELKVVASLPEAVVFKANAEHLGLLGHVLAMEVARFYAHGQIIEKWLELYQALNFKNDQWFREITEHVLRTIQRQKERAEQLLPALVHLARTGAPPSDLRETPLDDLVDLRLSNAPTE